MFCHSCYRRICNKYAIISLQEDVLLCIMAAFCFIFQTKKAMEIGKSGRIIVEDLIFLIRKDPKKYSRVKELLLMNEELRKARKAFDEIKYATSTK